ncbi:MAG: hypothetical protein AVDCRST_MAG93-4504, partial [uncultured Chloroflexia bacterium]
DYRLPRGGRRRQARWLISYADESRQRTQCETRFAL